MNTLLTTLVLGNLALNLVLLMLWLRSKKQTAALLARASATEEASHAVPADLNLLLSEHNKRVITVEIFNPIELATNKTILAKPLASVSPEMINVLVHKEARKLIEKMLHDFGVEAEVKIHVI